MSPSVTSQLHPNGVLPEGNAFVLGVDARRVRNAGLGSLLSRLSDEQIMDLLSFVGGYSLGKLCLASRVLYVFAHVDNLWRDLVLLETKGVGIGFCRSWKETFASLHSSTPIPVIKPIKVAGFFSQHLFHHFLCCSFDPDRSIPGLFRHEDIPRIEAAELSVKDFVEQFEIPNKPVVILNAVSDWPALQKWDEDYLARACGEKILRATSAAAAIPGHFTAKEYIEYAKVAKEESPLYLFDRDFARVETLSQDYFVPRYFSHAAFAEQGLTESIHAHTDLFRLLGETVRPDYRWLVVGPKRSGSIFHIDPNQTNAWNVCLTGRKKWIFYPPGCSPPGVESSADGAEVVVPVSTGEWLHTFWSFHQEARHSPDVTKRPLEAVLGPGELIFVPHGWWHMVINLDFTIALTHNYVGTSNLADVLRFLRDKSDQVSGVRCRQQDLVRPETLYDAFLAKLPQVLSEEEVRGFVEQSNRSNATKRNLISRKVGRTGNAVSKRKLDRDSHLDTDNESSSSTDQVKIMSNDTLPTPTTFSFSFTF